MPVLFPGLRGGHVPPHPRAIRAAAEMGPVAGVPGALRDEIAPVLVTLGVLRRARRRAQALIADAQRDGRTIDLSALEADLLADDEDETTLIVGQWRFVGVGWDNEGEVELARAAAARAREYAQHCAEQTRMRRQ